ncbi:MAG TPA: hypothetical protein VFE44_01605, partial [Thermoanaerobaculia bacterium]|nr:hypothetical protein [Thermoanaerobaculia bacterium]
MMLRDHAVPPALASVAARPERRRGVELLRADWQPPELGRLAGHLAGAGVEALRELGSERLLAAWTDVVD